MAFKKRWLLVILAGILVLSLISACTNKESSPAPAKPPASGPRPPVSSRQVDEISLEEAEDIMGAPVAPKYLPAGWEFRRGFVYPSPPPHTHLILFFSDEEMTEEVTTARDFASLKNNNEIILNISQEPETIVHDYERMAELWGGKVVDINGQKGVFSSGKKIPWITLVPPRGCTLV